METSTGQHIYFNEKPAKCPKNDVYDGKKNITAALPASGNQHENA